MDERKILTVREILSQLWRGLDITHVAYDSLRTCCKAVRMETRRIL